MTDAANTRHRTTDLSHTATSSSDRTQIAVRLDADLVFAQRKTGDLLLDLRGVDLDDLDSPITTRIDSGIGDIEVIVPFSADVELDVTQGIGETDLFGDSVTSGFFPGVGTDEWSGDSDPEFEITVNSGLGDVEVSRG